MTGPSIEQRTVEGFVIVGPGLNFGKDPVAPSTFGRTRAEAWMRFTGNNRDPIIRQRWREKGWRPVPVLMVVMAEGIADQEKG